DVLTVFDHLQDFGDLGLTATDDPLARWVAHNAQPVGQLAAGDFSRVGNPVSNRLGESQTDHHSGIIGRFGKGRDAILPRRFAVAFRKVLVALRLGVGRRHSAELARQIFAADRIEYFVRPVRVGELPTGKLKDVAALLEYLRGMRRIRR